MEAYPLHWPVGYRRTQTMQRKRALFHASGRNRLSVSGALDRLKTAVRGFTKAGKNYRHSGLVVSTNLPTRNDGMPYSNAREPVDCGVAVYFTLDNRPLVFCCDQWNRVADNIAAVAATLDAMRGIERWGVTETERAFTGFAALPEKGTARSCWDILGVDRDAPADAVKKAAASMFKKTHPDHGGSTEAFSEVREAWEQAKAERNDIQ